MHLTKEFRDLKPCITLRVGIRFHFEEFPVLYIELSADNKFSKQIYRVFNTEQVHILVALLFESGLKCTSIIPDLSAIVGQLELTQAFDYTPLFLYITL